MLAVLPVFRCSCSFLLFLFIVFQLFCLTSLIVLCIILADSLPAVLQDVMIYSAEVKGRFGYD